MSRICDISRAADHVMKFPRPSPSIFALLQAIKNWRRRRPGNEATSSQSVGWFTGQGKKGDLRLQKKKNVNSGSVSAWILQLQSFSN